jgi:hypothetical protein
MAARCGKRRTREGVSEETRVGVSEERWEVGGWGVGIGCRAVAEMTCYMLTAAGIWYDDCG